jgi:transposase-like protein
MSGKSLFGKDGAFAPMLKNVLKKALSAEMDSHLDSDERSKGNKRNGKGNKKLKSGFGAFDIETPKIVKAVLNRNWSKSARPFWRTAFRKRSSVSTV